MCLYPDVLHFHSSLHQCLPPSFSSSAVVSRPSGLSTATPGDTEVVSVNQARRFYVIFF